LGGILYSRRGIQALRSKGSIYKAKTGASSADLKKVFRQEVFVAALNPKVAVFFWHFFHSLLNLEPTLQGRSCSFTDLSLFLPLFLLSRLLF